MDKNEFEKFLRTSQGRDSIDSKLFEQIWAGIDVDCDGDNGSIPAIPISEYWTFKDNRLVTFFVYESVPLCEVGTPDSTRADRNDTIVLSDFKIDAKVFKAFLKLQLISGAVDSSGNSQFVDKWEFVELSNDVLYLAADDPAGSGAVQREFSRVK